MPSYIKTVGDLRRAVAEHGDDFPVEFWLNNVATNAYLGSVGESTQVNIVVEPNYTCKQEPV